MSFFLYVKLQKNQKKYKRIDLYAPEGFTDDEWIEQCLYNIQRRNTGGCIEKYIPR